jgi:hypothetical protein
MQAILPQVDTVLMIWNSKRECDWPASDRVLTIYTSAPMDPGINISAWWNRGLDHARILAGRLSDYMPPRWDVAILNDDAIVPEGWFTAVAGKMRDMKAAAACSGGNGPMSVFHTHPGPVGLDTRLQGFAFVVAGELGLRANESLKWYFTDDWMDWESRKLGGMVMIPGFHVEHLHPNGQLTPEIHAQIAQDAQTFVDIYGMRPW